MSVEAIAAILAIIEQAVAMMGASASTVTMIDSIIDGLTKLLPLIANFIPTFYASIKNIITALSANPSTLPAQAAALQQLDAQVDTAFEAAATAVDPDAAVTVAVTPSA
jgi:phage-related protein